MKAELHFTTITARAINYKLTVGDGKEHVWPSGEGQIPPPVRGFAPPSRGGIDLLNNIREEAPGVVELWRQKGVELDAEKILLNAYELLSKRGSLNK